MSAFTVPVTITGIESGLSETMDAVVDAGVLHSVIPADTLGRLGITPDWPHSFGVGMPDGSRVELPRGSAKARIHISVDGGELYRDDLCRTVPILFGPQKVNLSWGALRCRLWIWRLTRTATASSRRKSVFRATQCRN